MYRLLIVDDEEIIVNGLYEIFNSMKNLDLDVYRAYSGEEAIDWLNRTRIDIVLTDIRMPEMDGLQLLDEIYRSWPQCRVIFLTGYNEFEYIYKAIQHNSVDYILKTEDHEKVVTAVENAIKEIEKGIKIEDLIHKANEQLNMALELFQKDIFNHLLHGDSTININKVQFEQLGISIHPDQPVIMALGHMDSFPAGFSYWDKIQYIYSVRLIIGRHLNTHISYVIIPDESYGFVLLMQPKDFVTENQNQSEPTASFNRTVSFLKGTLEVIQSACRESLSASVSFVLSGEPCKWEEVSKKYYSLNQLFNYRIGSGLEMLLIDNELNFDVLNTAAKTEFLEAEYNVEALEALLRKRNTDIIDQYLESGQRDKFFEFIAELLDPLKPIRSLNFGIAIEAYYKVSLCLFSYINRWKLNEKIAFQTGFNKLMRIDRHESWEEAVEYIYSISNIIFNLQNEDQKKRADNAIDYVQKFIENHLGEDLSLVRLAEQVYLNPSYLSRLYKQVTGINLSDFIDNARVKKAKELLEKETVRINEVAKSVGYETAASFTRFFRKISGRSPQEYHEASLYVNK